MPGMFSGLSVFQGSWHMGRVSGNRERLGFKLMFANSILNKGFERQTEEL